LEESEEAISVVNPSPKFMRKSTLDRPSHLLQLAITSKGFEFVFDFVSIDKNFDDQESIARFITALIEKGKLNETINYVIREEMRENGLSILREESVGSSLLKSYWFHFEGKEFIQSVIGPLVKDIIKCAKSSLEVDPMRIDEGKAKKNLAKIIQITKNFLAHFFQSYHSFPDKFDQVLFTLYSLLTETEGARKSHLGLGYSEDALRLFGGFLLLRFICPPIVSPQKYGIIKEKENTPFVQRALVVVSKIIQSIANQVEFDKEKEPYLINANSVVQESMPQMLGFLNNLMMKISSCA